ncbi:MAG: hypothetical protein QW699_04055 [Metallosphaera sp.]
MINLRIAPKTVRSFFKGYGWPSYNYRPLYLQAIDFFTKNLGMIIPTIIALINSIIIAFVLNGLTSLLAFAGLSFGVIHVTAFIIGFISGVIYSFLILVEAYEAGAVVSGGVPDLGLAWQSTLNTKEKLLPSALIVGLIYGLFSTFFVPGAILIEGLLLIIIYVIASAIVNGYKAGIGEAIDWYSKSFSKDGASAVVLLLGAILSLIPILNLFVIPYTEILATLMIRKY